MRTRLGLVEVPHYCIINRTGCVSILFESIQEEIFLRPETVFRLASLLFLLLTRKTPSHRPQRGSFALGPFSLIRQRDNGLVHHGAEVI
jgi:hypothetical protein